MQHVFSVVDQVLPRQQQSALAQPYVQDWPEPYIYMVCTYLRIHIYTYILTVFIHVCRDWCIALYEAFL